MTRSQATHPTEAQSQSRPAALTPGLLTALGDPALRPKVIKAVTVGLAKGLGLSAAVLIPGLILLSVSPVAGVVWMFVGSLLLMLRTYARPWRLMWITCLTPAVAAGLCFLVQLAVFHDRAPPIWLLLPCLGLGIGAGVLRARSHSMYLENGSVMAKRTAGYLIIWATCYGITQLLGFFARTIPLVKGSLLTSAFSTAMLACVSIVILSRFLKLRSSLKGEIA